jgi:CheY-like chemotaxis protein
VNFVSNSVPSADVAARPVVVLVAEDEVLIRMAMADALRDAGFTVVEASSAVEALDAVKAGIRPDVLLTDVRMPGGIDGLQLAATLQEAFPSVVVFIASAHLPVIAQGAAMPNLIAKPYDPAVVVHRIVATLKSE